MIAGYIVIAGIFGFLAALVAGFAGVSFYLLPLVYSLAGAAGILILAGVRVFVSPRLPQDRCETSDNQPELTLPVQPRS